MAKITSSRDSRDRPRAEGESEESYAEAGRVYTTRLIREGADRSTEERRAENALWDIARSVARSDEARKR